MEARKLFLCTGLALIAGCGSAPSSHTRESAPPEIAERQVCSIGGEACTHRLAGMVHALHGIEQLSAIHDVRITNNGDSDWARENGLPLLTAEELPNLLARAKPVPADDELFDAWHYASFASGTFSYEGRQWSVELMLGGLGMLTDDQQRTAGFLYERQAPEVPVLSAEDLEADLDRERPFDPAALPERVKELEGKTVRIRGYIHAGSIYRIEFERFLLVTETKGKTYSPTHENFPLGCQVAVEMTAGTKGRYMTGPVIAEGILRFREYRFEDRIWSIYSLEEARVNRASPRSGYYSCLADGC